MSLQECRTADDVRALARRTIERRRAMMRPPEKPKPTRIEIKVASPEAVEIPIQREPTVVTMPEPGDVTVIPSVALIIETVATHHKITPLDIKSERRTKNVVFPRQIAAYLARRMTRRSLPEIGRIFGGRDHTTILHSVQKLERLRIADEKLDGELRGLEQDIQFLAAKALGMLSATD